MPARPRGAPQAKESGDLGSQSADLDWCGSQCWEECSSRVPLYPTLHSGWTMRRHPGWYAPQVTIVSNRLLVAIPAYNEEASIESVVNAVRHEAPEFDLLVINDGARDGTPEILRRLGVPTVLHYCNLGYGRAVQTAIKYARRHDYAALVTFDGDGQHRAG